MPTQLLSRLMPVVVASAVAASCAAQPTAPGPPGGDGGTPPLVIAHRGASGYLPEHTLPAYALAYAMGAHYIEQDLVMTRDRVLVVLHDIHLAATTDVEQRFPTRHRVDGQWYAADFTLQEIKSLTVHERTGEDGQRVFPNRYAAASTGFQVPTFEEAIELVTELNRINGCQVGLYPETKDPAFHAAEGLALEEELLRVLDAHGYSGPEARVFIQSFDPANLKRLRHELGTELPLVQLISGAHQQDYLVTPEGLDEVAQYANGIGPEKGRVTRAQRADGTNALIEAAHARGLVVHPYTFRADDLPDGETSLESELERFVGSYGVDGFFTDHADRAVRLLDPERTGQLCPR